MRRLEAVECDGARFAVALQSFAEERFGGSHIPRAAEMRLHCAAAFVHGAVQVYPSARNLDICLITAP